MGGNVDVELPVIAAQDLPGVDELLVHSRPCLRPLGLMVEEIRHLHSHTRIPYAHTHIRTYAHTRMRAYAHTNTHIRTYAHTRIRTYEYARTHIRIRTYAHTHIRTYAHTHIRTYAHTHIRTYAHTHIRTYAHTHTRAPLSVVAHVQRALSIYTYKDTPGHWRGALCMCVCVCVCVVCVVHSTYLVHTCKSVQVSD